MTAPNINLKRTKQGLEVWVSQPIVLHYCDTDKKDFSEYLRRAARYRHRKGCPSWKFTEENGTFYYHYDFIPENSRVKLPTREQLIEMANKPVHAQAENLLQIDAKAFIENDHRNHIWKYAEHKELQAVNLARACSFLVWAVKHIVETDMDTRPMDFFIGCCEIIRNLEIKHLPPNHHRSLKEYIKLILDGSCSVEQIVKLDNVGNTNSVAHKEDRELIGWIFQLRASGANYTNEYIVRKVFSECEKIGKEKPSRKWIIDKINEHETKYLTAISRFGMKSKMGNRYRFYIPLANAMFAGDCWQIDATRVNMLPHKSESKKRGEYLSVIKVIDVHSGLSVGTSYDVSENRWSYASALFDAVQMTGYLPHEIRIDRFPGHNTPEMKKFLARLEAMGVKITITHDFKGKANVERWFSTMQHIALQESPMYYGEGIMSRRQSAHRTLEFMAASKKLAKANGWDFDMAVAETNRRIETWMHKPFCEWSKKCAHLKISPFDMHKQSEKPNVIPVSEHQQTFLFGLEKELQIRSGFIRTEINKELFEYQISDTKILQRYDKVLCFYNVNDLSTVHLYAPSESIMKVYLGTAEEYIRPQQYGANPEHGQIAKVRAIFNEIERSRQEELEQKMVVNGGIDYGRNEMAVISPLTVSKREAEVAEAEETNKFFKWSDDEGEDIDHTSLKGI